MKDYSKMLTTVKAIQDKFNSAEFTRKDYVEKIMHDDSEIAYQCYCPSVALNRDYCMVKKVREEDYIVEDTWGKHVGTRYFYEVNDKFLIDLHNMIKKDISDLETKIVKAEQEIAKIEERIKYKKAVLETFEALTKELDLD